ncbi:MAG: SDR family NAD(P)-dependent oxidoreductase, partial [bacterium]
MQLIDKIAIVTGSSRGFGARIAEHLSEQGANVVVSYFREDEAEKQNAQAVAERIKADLVLPLDVRDRKSVRQMMQTTHAKYGRIDILVNNAGINIVGDFDKI